MDLSPQAKQEKVGFGWDLDISPCGDLVGSFSKLMWILLRRSSDLSPIKKLDLTKEKLETGS